MRSRFLLTGYRDGNKYDLSTTRLMLEKISKYDTFLLSNDRGKIIEEVKVLLDKDYDYILMFGHKPNIKKLNIEIECSINNDYRYTNFPLKIVLDFLKRNRINYKLSENPGNSYCNFAYYQMLKSIEDSNLNTKVIFIHIPYKDNFVQFDEFVKALNEGVDENA